MKRRIENLFHLNLLFSSFAEGPNWLWNFKFQITNYKSQTNSNPQCPNDQTYSDFVIMEENIFSYSLKRIVWVFEFWLSKLIWCLGFGAYPKLGCLDQPHGAGHHRISTRGSVNEIE